MSKKSSEQNNNLVQKCTMIEELFMFSVNTIHAASFILPDVGYTDKNIVLYIYSRQTWVNKLLINLQIHKLSFNMNN